MSSRISSDIKVQKEELKSHEVPPILSPDLQMLVAAIKIANKDLGDKIDGLGKNIDSLGDSLGEKIDSLGEKIDGLGEKIDGLSKVFILNVHRH